eukprot:5916515-Pleurochrysis_carterae.AAC.2
MSLVSIVIAITMITTVTSICLNYGCMRHSLSRLTLFAFLLFLLDITVFKPYEHKGLRLSAGSTCAGGEGHRALCGSAAAE